MRKGQADAAAGNPNKCGTGKQASATALPARTAALPPDVGEHARSSFTKHRAKRAENPAACYKYRCFGGMFWLEHNGRPL